MDDFPVPKPYAEEMDSLEEVWDANQERLVPGYHVVPCYYHHPTRPSYALLLEPWRKTSRTGEQEAKLPPAHRRAKLDEERSKLDIALDGWEEMRPLFQTKVPVIFDGWYFARWFVSALTELGYPSISRAGTQRKFDVPEGDMTVPELIDRYQERLQPVPHQNRSAQAYALPAILPPDKSTPHAHEVQLVLVQDFFPQENEEKMHVLGFVHF